MAIYANGVSSMQIDNAVSEILRLQHSTIASGCTEIVVKSENMHNEACSMERIGQLLMTILHTFFQVGLRFRIVHAFNVIAFSISETRVCGEAFAVCMLRWLACNEFCSIQGASEVA